MNFQDSINLRSKEPIYRSDPNISISDQKSTYKKPREFLDSLIIDNSDRVLNDYPSFQKPIVQTRPQYEDKQIVQIKPQNDVEDLSSGVQCIVIFTKL